MDWVTTSTILQRLRNFDDATAWQGFVARFRRPIISFALKIGVPAAGVEDVAQETLLAFAESLRQGRYERAKGRLSRWLFAIAYKKALRHLERAPRREVLMPEDSEGASPLPDVPDERAATTIWDRQWEAHAVRECIRRAREEFTPQTFRAFQLIVAEERSPAEAATELGVSIKVVYNAKHRVLKRVRELRAELEAIEEGGARAVP